MDFKLKYMIMRQKAKIRVEKRATGNRSWSFWFGLLQSTRGTECFSLTPGSQPVWCATNSTRDIDQKDFLIRKEAMLRDWGLTAIAQWSEHWLFKSGALGSIPRNWQLNVYLFPVEALKLLTLHSTLHRRRTFLQVGFLDHCTCTSLSATHQQAYEWVCATR